MWKIIFENFIFLFPIFGFTFLKFLTFLTFDTFLTFHTFFHIGGFRTFFFFQFPIFIFPFDLGNLTLAFLKYLTLGFFRFFSGSNRFFPVFPVFSWWWFLHIFSWWWFLHILCQSPHFLYYCLYRGVPPPPHPGYHTRMQK